MKKAVLMILLLAHGIPCLPQECANCNELPRVAHYDLDVQVAQPELKEQKTEGWLEYLQLFWISRHAEASLFQADKECLRIIHPNSLRQSDEKLAEADPQTGVEDIMHIGQTYTHIAPEGPLGMAGDYLITGSIRPDGTSYVVTMELQTGCGRKTIASAAVAFERSSSSEYTMGVANQLVAQLSPLSERIREFELKERDKDPSVALNAMNDDQLIIRAKNPKIRPGEKTELEITLRDCDGRALSNREISFTGNTLTGIAISGTTGGSVTPEKVYTDSEGKATANFLLKEEFGILNAHYVHNTPSGCPGVKLGSLIIGGSAVKVDMKYVQYETHSFARGTLPGMKISGGEEIQQTIMGHHSVLYYYPSVEDLEEGVIVDAYNDDGDNPNTHNVLEAGYYEYRSFTHKAKIDGMVDNRTLVTDMEEGDNVNFFGFTTLEHPSQILFQLGNENEPASFSWSVEYPIENGNYLANGTIIINEDDDDGVSWQTRRIDDMDSPYKTEFILRVTRGVADLQKENSQAMKDLFGFDLDQLAGAMDPTDPKRDLATAAGFITLSVRIQTPYEMR